MRLNGLRALRLSSWLLWGVALLAMIDDVAGWWLADARDFPHLFAGLGLLVCGNAVEHARALLALQAGELAALRSAGVRERL